MTMLSDALSWPCSEQNYCQSVFFSFALCCKESTGMLLFVKSIFVPLFLQSPKIIFIHSFIHLYTIIDQRDALFNII